MAVAYTTAYGYGTDTAWEQWATTSTNVTSNVVWQTWAGTTASTTNITQQVWDWWATSTGSGQYTIPYQMPALTEEELAAAAERNRLAAIAAEERRAQRVVADKKARLLLLDCLEDEQKQELEKDGYFHVETRDGTRRYRLRPGGQPVRVHGEDGRHWAYCIHPDHGFPTDDVVLAQKLLLESDEEEFLRIANARLTTV